MAIESSSLGSNNGSTSETVECPFFTKSGYNSETNKYYCDYYPWAYGLFAIVALLLIMVPLVQIICCVVRARHKGRISRRSLRSIVSNNSYSSTDSPHRPLIRESRQNYGAVEQEYGSASSRLSPNFESVSEQPSQQHDNRSTTSSKASMFPNYDQVSLDLKNSTAGTKNLPKNLDPLDLQNTRNNFIPHASYNLVSDSISTSKDVPNKTKSPIYSVLEEASPDERCESRKEPVEQEPVYAVLEPPENINNIIIPENNQENVSNEGHEEPVTAVEQEPVYAILEPPENSDINIPENNQEHDENNEQFPENINEEKKAYKENASEGTDIVNDIPEVKYAQNKDEIVFDSNEPTAYGLSDAQKDADNRDNSPIYNILEPLLLEDPKRDDDSVGRDINDPLKEHLSEGDSCKADESDGTKLCSECTDTPEPMYMPLLPPKERSSGNDDNSSDYQPLSPKPLRERLASRTDYEEFLKDMIKSLPESERNGVFILRDSLSSPGSKALTVYNKTSNSDKEVFNFKVCFDEKGQAFLAKSTKRFPSLEQLLQYLRTNKDMLPCTLKTELN